MTRAHAALWRRLAGDDGPGRRALPASELLAPLPLGAALLLVGNDWLLKPSSAPRWLTGKLSDVAGLFFFPLLLGALARGAARLGVRREIQDRSSLAMAAVLATGAVFTAVKLHAPFNAWVAGVWGVMVMDVTDLFTLPVLGLSAAFMVRSRAQREGFAPARRFLDFGAVIAASLASAATSAPPPPAQPPQPQAVAPAVEVAAPAPAACGSLALSVCERSETGTFVVIEASGGGCEVEILRAEEISPMGGTPADALPARVRVEDRGPSTFSLSFLRAVDPGTQTHNVDVALEVRRVSGEVSNTDVEKLNLPCKAR
jgi:hypothetical protein